MCVCVCVRVCVCVCLYVCACMRMCVLDTLTSVFNVQPQGIIRNIVFIEFSVNRPHILLVLIVPPTLTYVCMCVCVCVCVCVEYVCVRVYMCALRKLSHVLLRKIHLKHIRTLHHTYISHTHIHHTHTHRHTHTHTHTHLVISHSKVLRKRWKAGKTCVLFENIA